MCAEASDEKYNHETCDNTFLVYKDREHVKEVTEQGDNLGTLGEFCGAFYHVPKVPRTSEMVCLDPETCQVLKPLPGKEVDHCAQPKTAVAFVKYEIEGKVILKRYTNCYSKKAHAEEFFSYDIIKQKRERSLANTAKGLITMYITMQPCHHSTFGTGGTPNNYSCCDMLIDLVNNHLPENVEICIKPTHLCKAGWKRPEKNPNLDKQIENAEEGLKILMGNPRIEFSVMDADDWGYLWQHVDVPEDCERNIPDEERKALDDKNGEQLADWKEEVEKQAAGANEITKGLDDLTVADQEGKK